MQLRLSNNKFDMCITGGQLDFDDTPITDVISSIFTNLSWYGHRFAGFSGSILGTTINAGLLKENDFNMLTNNIKNSCQHLIDSDKIKEVNVKRVINNNSGKVELQIFITLPNNQIYKLAL